MKIHIIGRGFIAKALAALYLRDDEHQVSVGSDVVKEHFDLVIYASGTSRKYYAGECPVTCFYESVFKLYHYMHNFSFERFVLLSSIDAENSVTNYGAIKSLAEDAYNACQKAFKGMILRLPAMVGPGLQKGVVFDLVHRNELRISQKSILQIAHTDEIKKAIDYFLSTKEWRSGVILTPADTISVEELVSICCRGELHRYVDCERHKQDYSSLIYAQPSFEKRRCGTSREAVNQYLRELEESHA